ncbi:hypothetical protein FACS1894214_0770 [Planctomycetales bacterium]|nr:hypothetical protein FACS1894214_0770 [Planctomycetales bacterium]
MSENEFTHYNSEADRPVPQSNPPGNAPQSNQQVPIQFDDSRVAATYANFCRVTGTPEELIVDFGLNPQPVGIPNTPIVVSDRIVLNFYTAKRLFFALQATLQRHEQAFGVLEIDVNKRFKGQQPNQ